MQSHQYNSASLSGFNAPHQRSSDASSTFTLFASVEDLERKMLEDLIEKRGSINALKKGGCLQKTATST